MDITCWGARGSIPVSGKEYVRYGGDTPCIEVRAASGEIIIIDAGSGIRKAGNRLMSEGKKQFIMLFTHVHWDHLLGFPFFRPIYYKDTHIDVYGCPFTKGSMKESISQSMAAPYFPVEFDSLPSDIVFHGACDGNKSFGSIDIDVIRLSHPNHGIGFKFTENGKSFVYLTDNELTFKHPGGLDFEDYRKFSEGADILIHDAEFKLSEYANTKTWGHTVYTDALDLALKAGVKRFGLFHHNQERSDDAIDEMVADCKRISAENGSTLDCFAVSAGMELSL